MTLGPRAETAINLLREVMGGICARPDLLNMEVHNGQVIELAVTCHPTDSRRLVGKRRSHLNALGTLAGLLLDGTGRRVTLLPVRSLDLPETPWKDLEVDPEWPSDRVVGLVRRLVEAALPDVRCQIEVVPHDQRSSRVEIYLPEVREFHGAILKFAEALHTLFIPYGSSIGQVLYVNVNTGAPNEELDRGRDLSGRDARSARAAGVSRSEPDARRVGTPGRSDGPQRVGRM